MNLPNKLTMMRVVLVPVFMIFAAVSHYGTADFNAAYMLIAGVIFAIASITDFLDGYPRPQESSCHRLRQVHGPAGRQVPDHRGVHLHGHRSRLLARRAGGHPVP